MRSHTHTHTHTDRHTQQHRLSDLVSKSAVLGNGSLPALGKEVELLLVKARQRVVASTVHINLEQKASSRQRQRGTDEQGPCTVRHQRKRKKSRRFFNFGLPLLLGARTSAMVSKREAVQLVMARQSSSGIASVVVHGYTAKQSRRAHTHTHTTHTNTHSMSSMTLWALVVRFEEQMGLEEQQRTSRRASSELVACALAT